MIEFPAILPNERIAWSVSSLWTTGNPPYLVVCCYGRATVQKRADTSAEANQASGCAAWAPGHRIPDSRRDVSAGPRGSDAVLPARPINGADTSRSGRHRNGVPADQIESKGRFHGARTAADRASDGDSQPYREARLKRPRWLFGSAPRKQPMSFRCSVHSNRLMVSALRSSACWSPGTTQTGQRA
jgi:hypothetical protein